jgi:hypothetical protein
MRSERDGRRSELRARLSERWISDPSCHLAEQRVVGVVEGRFRTENSRSSAAAPMVMEHDGVLTV